MPIVRYTRCDRSDYLHSEQVVEFSESPFPEPTEAYFTNNIRITLPEGYLVCGHEKACPGYQLTMRAHGLYFHWCRSGKGTYNGIPFQKNDVFIVHRGSPKVMIADEEDPWEFFWCVWKGDIANIATAKFNNLDDNTVYVLENNPDLSALFQFFIYQPHRERRMQKVANSFVELLLSDCHMIPKDATNKFTASHSKIITEIQRYINQNFADITVEKLAQHFHYNRKYITRIFHEYTGVTLCDYIREAKLRCAETYLISSNMSVEEIAFRSSYSNYSTFIKAFKKKNGVTPSEFIKLFR